MMARYGSVGNRLSHLSRSNIYLLEHVCTGNDCLGQEQYDSNAGSENLEIACRCSHRGEGVAVRRGYPYIKQ